jgi:hypothetical protein
MGLHFIYKIIIVDLVPHLEHKWPKLHVGMKYLEHILKSIAQKKLHMILTPYA